MQPTDATASGFRLPAADVPRTSTLPLSVAGVSYRTAGRTLLEKVSFTVERGTFNVILGPNGAGKSLLLRLCHGLLQPDEGHISWAGLPPGQARRHHAMVFQDPVMLRRSVAANIVYPLKIRQVPRAERQLLLQAALRLANIEHLANTPASRLSGGEQQRVALTRAWVVRPDALLLDEPTANLDPHSTLAVEAMIAAMRAQGTTIIMTTHDLAQARRLAERVLFLSCGRLLADAGACSFFENPENPEARAFLDGKLIA